MKLFISVMVLYLLFCSGFAGADYYRYKDKDGAVTFTDDLSQVPVEQRQTIENFHEVKQVPGKSIEGKKESEATLPDNSAARESRLNALKQTKSNLDAEYAALQIERQKVLNLKNSGTLELNSLAYSKKVQSLNDKIRTFEKKRSLLQREMELFSRE